MNGQESGELTSAANDKSEKFTQFLIEKSLVYTLNCLASRSDVKNIFLRQSLAGRKKKD